MIFTWVGGRRDVATSLTASIHPVFSFLSCKPLVPIVESGAFLISGDREMEVEDKQREATPKIYREKDVDRDMTNQVEDRIEETNVAKDETAEVSMVRSKKIGGLTMTSISKIVETDYPEMKWAVDGFIPEGLTLLGGNPKCGKSWTVLELMLSVASGRQAFGSKEVEQGSVLYLALEDTERRIKDRTLKLTDGEMPDNAWIVTTSPTIDKGLIGDLESWIKETEDSRLIIVDVFGKVRGDSSGGKQTYNNDYKELEEFKELADEHSLSIVVIMHTSKRQNQDDVFKNILGTQGVTGCADTIIVMERPRNHNKGIFHTTSRDMGDGEIGLVFEDGRITITEEVPEIEKEIITQEDKVIRILEESNEPLKKGQILEKMEEIASETTPGNMDKLLSRLVKERKIERVERGIYTCLCNPVEFGMDYDEEPEDIGNPFEVLETSISSEVQTEAA